MLEAVALVLEAKVNDGSRATTGGGDRAGQIVVGGGGALAGRRPVRVRVDASGQDVFVGRVEDARACVGLESVPDLDDLLARDANVGAIGVRSGDQCAVFYQEVHAALAPRVRLHGLCNRGTQVGERVGQ